MREMRENTDGWDRAIYDIALSQVAPSVQAQRVLKTAAQGPAERREA